MEVMELAMSLIAGAGDAKSDAMEAIAAAKSGKFEEARDLIRKAAAALQSTHDIQTQLIRDEMSGKSHETTLLMVHAQDHLTSAQMMRDIAEEITDLYELIMKGGVKNEDAAGM